MCVHTLSLPFPLHLSLPLSNTHAHKHTHAHTHIQTHTHKHTHTHTHKHAHKNTHTHTCTHTYTHEHTHLSPLSLEQYMCIPKQITMLHFCHTTQELNHWKVLVLLTVSLIDIYGDRAPAYKW